MDLSEANRIIAEKLGMCLHEQQQARRSSDDYMDWYCCNPKCGIFLRQAEWENGKVLPYKPMESDKVDFTQPDLYMKLMEWDKISWNRFERWLRAETSFACLSEFMGKPASLKIVFIAEAIKEGVI